MNLNVEMHGMSKILELMNITEEGTENLWVVALNERPIDSIPDSKEDLTFVADARAYVEVIICKFLYHEKLRKYFRTLRNTCVL